MWLNLLITLCEMCFDLMDDMWGSGTPLSLANLLGVRIPVGPLVRLSMLPSLSMTPPFGSARFLAAPVYWIRLYGGGEGWNCSRIHRV